MLRRIVSQMVKVTKCPVTVTKCPHAISSRLISTDDFSTDLGTEFFERATEPSINEVSLMGRVGSDPYRSQTDTGTNWAVINLAVNSSTGNKTVGYKKETVWFRVLLNQEGQMRILDTTQKGDRVYVHGKLLPFRAEYVRDYMVPTINVRAEKFFVVQRKVRRVQESDDEEREQI